MKRIPLDNKLVDVVRGDFLLFLIFYRLGMTEAYGNLTVRQACIKYKVDVDFCTLVVNSFLDRNYVPEFNVENISVDNIMTYLSRLHETYVNEYIREIKEKFISLRQLKSTRTLNMINKIFLKSENNYLLHQNYKLEYVYPYVEKYLKGELNELKDDIYFFIKYEEETYKDECEAEIDDLINLCLAYVPPGRQRESVILLGVLESFKRDVMHYLKIEQLCLFDRVRKLKS
ncbi:MAG: hypothetical protein N4A32_01250 [Marinifilaceae bacterium]|jgi:hypothetical protein|nr:hypothetical protein [Marinifilaceae bacterium]